MKKKKLILVGNKLPRKEDLSEEIDSFDFILRINRMNYIGPAGQRIDGLFLEANDEFKKKYAGGPNKDRIKSAGKLLMKRQWYNRFDVWSQYLSPIQYNQIEIIDESFAIRETGFLRLTTPILLLGYLLNSKWAEDYQIHITCLDIENRAMLIDNDPTWTFHKGAGAVEQEYLLNHIKSENLIRIYDE